jgi:drug/metabolite transporter (DMT)-like permease
MATLTLDTLRFRDHVQPHAGFLCMAGAMLLLPIGDTFAKLLAGPLDPVAVTMWRLVAQGAFLFPAAFLLRHRLRRSMISPVVMLSGALLAISLTSLITAFSYMPIATAIAIFFVEPLILTVLSGPLLGEYAGPRRLLAVAVGLLGALIVIQPGFSIHGWATLLPLLSASAYALNMIILKRGSQTRSSLTMQCGATLFGMGILIVICLLLSWRGRIAVVPEVGQEWAWLAIFAAGAVAAVSFILVAEAFRREDATVLAPFQYLEILSATALGFAVFKDFPNVLTWVGITIILGSGVYIFRREGRSVTSAPRRRRSLR